MFLAKCIFFFFNQIKKKKYSYPYLDLTRENIQKNGVEVLLEEREKVGLKNTDCYYPNSKTKAKRYQSISKLRLILYKNDCILHAKELKVINHNVSGEELLKCVQTNTLTKPLVSTHITFGNEINELLKNILGKGISLRKRKFTTDTYLLINNYDYNSITDELSRMYQEDVRIKIDVNNKIS